MGIERRGVSEPTGPREGHGLAIPGRLHRLLLPLPTAPENFHLLTKCGPDPVPRPGVRTRLLHQGSTRAKSNP